MKKQLDWHFWFKIVISILGLIFMFSFVLTKWALSRPDEYNEDEDDKSPGKRTDPRKPLRLQIMSLNTLTLFFLLMSIGEYRTNEFMSPFGVDPDKIPSKCKIEQEAYTWVVMICCAMIVFYNYFMVGNVLSKANVSNIVFAQKKQKQERRGGLSFYRIDRSGNNEKINSINEKVKSMKPLNADFMAEIYPQRAEFVFFVLIAALSIVMYTMCVLSNYGVFSSKMFKSCVHPIDNDRYYDPFLDE